MPPKKHTFFLLFFLRLRKAKHEIVVDIMFTACAETYESLSKYAVKADLDGIAVNTVNLEGLLLTKRSPRGKDITDRQILETALKILREQNLSHGQTADAFTQNLQNKPEHKIKFRK